MAILGSAEFIIGANISRLNASLNQANKMIGKSFTQAAVSSSKILSTAFNSGFGSAVGRATKQLSSMRSVVGTPAFALGLTTAASSIGAIAVAGPNLLLTFKTLKELTHNTPALQDLFSVYYFKETINNLTGVIHKWQLLNAKINVVQASLQAVINAQQYMGTSLSGQALQGPTLATMWDAGTGVQLFAAMEEYELRMRAIRTASGDTNKEVGRLLSTIREQSKESKTVSIDLAQTANEMVNLGFTSTEAAESLRAVRQAAVATGQTTASVATSVQKALEGFNLDASNAQRVADVLAKTSINTSLSFDRLATGLQRTSAIASQTGQSLEDMTVTLALMNATGKSAATSGDRIARMLLSLQKAAQSNSAALQELGLGYGKLVSSDGSSLRSMTEIIPLIKEATTGLSVGKSQGLLEEILGGKENAIAMIELLSRSNKEIDQLMQKASNATGFNANIFADTNQGVAAAMADLQYRIGAVSEIVGDTYAPVMEWATNATGQLLNVFLEFPPVLQQSIVQWGILIGIYKLFFGYTKLYLYWTKASAVATKAWTFAQQENATQLAVLKAQTIGQTIAQKVQAVQQSISARVSLMTAGSYTKQALAADLVTLKTRAATVAQTAFAASQKTSLAATQLLWRTLGGSIAAAYGAILLFQGATERTEGAKQAIKLKEATRELAASYQEIGSELDNLSSDYDSFWQGIGEAAISTFDRIQKEGLVAGSRDSVALLLESEGNRIDAEIKRLEEIQKKRRESFGGRVFDEFLRFGRGGRSISESLQSFRNETDTRSDYGNQRGFSTTAQLGNIKIMQQMEATQRQLNDSFQAGIDLRSRQNISNDEFVAKARPLVEHYEREITAIKAIKVQTDAQRIAQQAMLKPIEANRDALLRRIYAIEQGIEINSEYALSFAEISNALKRETSDIDKNLAQLQARIAEARASSQISSEEASGQLLSAEIEAIESRISTYQEKLEELNAVSIGKHSEQAEEIKRLQSQLTNDLLSERRKLAEKQISIGEQEVESFAKQYNNMEEQLNQFHQQAILQTKQAWAQQQIDRKEYNEYIRQFEETSIKERQSMLQEEQELLKNALSKGKITREQFEKRTQELKKESMDLMNKAADLEIQRQRDIAKAYDAKLSVMGAEISLQQSLNELDLIRAQEGGASEVQIGEMRIEQLRQMQEMQRQELELQLAKNLASAEDVALQQQLNDLIRKRFEVNAERELIEADRPSTGGGGGTDYEAQARSMRIEALKNEADLRSALLEKEAAGIERTNELRSQELSLLDQTKERLEQRLEIQQSNSRILTTQLEEQISLADELLGLLNAGTEAEEIRAEIAKDLNLPAQASELDILEKKYQIQQQLAQEQAAQTKRQHDLQDQILRLEGEQNIINAEQAIQESAINELKSQQAVLAAEAAIATAELNNESREQIQIAQIDLELAQRQLALSGQQTQSATEALDAIKQQNAARTAALDLQQTIERSERNATIAATDRASRLAIATAEARTHTEDMADAMGQAADSAGRAADEMGRAADSAVKAADSAAKAAGGTQAGVSVSHQFQNVDLENVAKQELELAAKLADLQGNTAKATAIRAQIAAENHKSEMEMLLEQANHLREQRQLYHQQRQDFIDLHTQQSRQFHSAVGVPTLKDHSAYAIAQAEKIFGGMGGLGDFSNNKSMQLLNKALQGFNPQIEQIQQQQMKEQQRMNKAISDGNKEMGKKLDRINDTIGRAMSRPVEVNVRGSNESHIGRTLEAIRRAQR